MKGGFEPATIESQVEHSTTEPKPLLAIKTILLQLLCDKESRYHKYSIWRDYNLQYSGCKTCMFWQTFSQGMKKNSIRISAGK